MSNEIRITSITIENFKGISNPVTIPLKPITLLFGKNSAGKSTVLHAMLYMLEVIRTGNPDIDKIQLGGDAINLGGFKNIVHKHDLSKTIKLKFDLKLGSFGLETFQYHVDLLENSEEESSWDSELYDDVLGELETVGVELEIGIRNGEPAVLAYNLWIHDSQLLSVAKIFEGSCVIGNIDLGHQLWDHKNDDPLIYEIHEYLQARDIEEYSSTIKMALELI